MANRFDWNALNDKIKLTKENYEILNTESKTLTSIALSAILETDIEDAIDAITDGGNDRGVDALFIDDRENSNDIHLMQTKCVSSFDNSKKNYPGNEVDKIVSFVADLLNGNKEALELSNPQLKRKIADALDILKHTNATITVHFVGNMEALIESELKRIKAVFEKYKAVRFEMHDLDALSDFFLAKNTPVLNRTLTAIDTNFFDRTDLNLRGLVCTVAATDIVNMIKSEKDKNIVEMGIFDQNVRVYLKRKNRINQRIIKSAKAEDNHMFWYQNNGITITCDKIEVAPSRRSPQISMNNIQIVNGGQTSNCLFEAAKEEPEKIEEVLLLVRIIETTSEDVKLSIAESTNSQTPINVRDLRANDRQQRQLEENFLEMGYYYERKANQFENQQKDKRIDALSAGQAYLAYSIGLPEVAKKDRGRVFGNLYDTVFTDDLTTNNLYISMMLIKQINEKKTLVRQKIKNDEKLSNGELSLIDGAFHALFAVRQILNSKEISLWEYSEAEKFIDQGIEIIGNLYSEAQEKNPNFSSNRFFKDARTKDKITKMVA